MSHQGEESLQLMQTSTSQMTCECDNQVKVNKLQESGQFCCCVRDLYVGIVHITKLLLAARSNSAAVCVPEQVSLRVLYLSTIIKGSAIGDTYFIYDVSLVMSVDKYFLLTTLINLLRKLFEPQNKHPRVATSPPWRGSCPGNFF